MLGKRNDFRRKAMNKKIKLKVNTELILSYIKDHNLTKKEFCAQCGITPSTLNSIMKGNNVKLSSVRKLMSGLNVSFYQIFE